MGLGVCCHSTLLGLAVSGLRENGRGVGCRVNEPSGTQRELEGSSPQSRYESA